MMNNNHLAKPNSNNRVEATAAVTVTTATMTDEAFAKGNNKRKKVWGGGGGGAGAAAAGENGSSSAHNQLSREEYNLRIETILDKERLENKSQKWNRLDNSVRIEKMHAFADTFVHSFSDVFDFTKSDHRPPLSQDQKTRAVEELKIFFNECLQRKKLTKAKEVLYNLEKGIIDAIPSLHCDFDACYSSIIISSSDSPPSQQQQQQQERSLFFLKNKDAKYLSTSKSLTPRRELSTTASASASASASAYL